MNRTVFFVVVILVAMAASVDASSWPERIGSAEVRAGAVTRGTIPLVEHADGSTVAAPVIVVAGRERGPIAWLIACGHGDEFGGALAVRRLAQGLDPAQLKGLVVLVPVANPPAFQAMRRVNPSLDDMIDFGDAFPGRPRFATERIAAVYSALWAEHADYVVDLHTGGDRFIQQPFVIFTIAGEVPAPRMEELARLFGAPTLWRDRTKLFKNDVTMTLPDRGIPAFLLEVGGGASMSRQQDERQAELAMSFLRGVGIAPGAPTRAERVDYVEEYRIVTPARGGFFHALAKPGDRLQEGTPIGRVVNVYGEEVEVLRSPVGNAILLGIQDYPVVATGAWVAELGILSEP